MGSKKPKGSKQPGSPGPTDLDQGLWQGRSVARRFISPDGLIVLVGRSASDNDIVSIKLGRPNDFWLHIAADSGSHVLVLNPDGLDRLPRATQDFAAGLAAHFSKARKGGRVAVHLARCGDVAKPRGLPPGKVTLKRHRTVHATPIDPAG